MKTIKNIFKAGTISLIIPLISLAQVTNVNVFDILGTVTDILAVVIPILLIIATIIFIYGLITYILLSAGDAAKRAEARNIMIWGIVILFVTVAVWGLVKVIENTFRVERENIPQGPQAPVIPGL